MTTSSPQNPNICMACEQLLEDDRTELEKLIHGTSPPEDSSPEVVFDLSETPEREAHEILAGCL
jgi:hypothetical protein